MGRGFVVLNMFLSLVYQSAVCNCVCFFQDQEFHDSDLFDDMITSRSNDASGDVSFKPTNEKLKKLCNL